MDTRGRNSFLRLNSARKLRMSTAGLRGVGLDIAARPAPADHGERGRECRRRRKLLIFYRKFETPGANLFSTD